MRQKYFDLILTLRFIKQLTNNKKVIKNNKDMGNITLLSNTYYYQLSRIQCGAIYGDL
jgi:hypothetical protein